MSEVQGVDEVNAKLERLLSAGSLSREAYLEFGNILVSEMQENFRVGGRPTPWPLSQRVKTHGGQTLRLTGRLMRSLTAGESDDGASVGTNVAYARIQALGGTIDRFPHSRLGVTFKTFESGEREGKTLFAKKGRKGSFTQNVTVNRAYKITIPQRDFRYISPRGWKFVTMAAIRRLQTAIE